MDRKLTREAKSGNVYAMLALGYMYRTGKDAEKDPAGAIKWYARAYYEGSGRAAWELSRIYSDGDLVEPDRYEYIRWLIAAAEGGMPEAQRDLSVLFLHGSGVNHDDAEAFRWLKLAAEGGDLISKFRLAMSYESSCYGEHDPARAKEIFKEIERKGNGDVFLHLGMDLEFGLEGCKKDKRYALDWYRLGASLGHDRCTMSKERLSAHLYGDQPEDSLEDRRGILANSPSLVSEDVARESVRDGDTALEKGDWREAEIRYNEAGALGDGDAYLIMAFAYHMGEVVKRNDYVAIDLLIKASMVGSTDAQILLGRCYRDGIGMKQDIGEAMKYFAMAARGDNLIGYYELSLLTGDPDAFVRNGGE